MPVTPVVGPAQPTNTFDATAVIREKMQSKVINFTVRGIVLSTSSVCPAPQAHELVDLLMNDKSGTELGRNYVKSFMNYPGPLTPATKVESIRQHLENIAPSGPLQTLLTASLTKPLDWAQGGPSLFVPFLQGSEPVVVTPVHPQARPLPQEGDVKMALESVQSLLQQGNRQGAISTATEANQWMLALLIATMCDKEAYLKVVSNFIRTTMDTSSPLATVLLQFNDMAPDTTNIAAWKEHVQMLLVNYVKATTTLPAIAAWGDALLAANLVDEAHFCYMVAQKASPQQYANKILLCGGNYRRDLWRSTLINDKSLFQTEILELSKKKEAGSNASDQRQGRASFQPFKVAFALMFLELGMQDKCAAILDVVSKAIPSATSRKEDQPISNLPQFVEALKGRLKRLGKQESTSRGWSFGWGRSAKPGPVVTNLKEDTPPAGRSPVPQATTTTTREVVPQGKVGTPKAQAGGWWPFGRGGEKKDKAKDIILPEDDVKPEYDANTGRWVVPGVQQTPEEIDQERRAKAGPPKMIPAAVAPSPNPNPTSPPPGPLQMPAPMTHGTTPASGPPGPQRPGPTGPPPPPGGLTAKSSDLASRYVDVFNS
jgi:hypothetical protein